MKDTIKAILGSINKKFGDNTMGMASDVVKDITRLPSGSLFLDYTLGTDKKANVGGWPMGRIIELYGPESSGKSLISMKTIVEAQKLDKLCIYFDSEDSFDNKFAGSLGVDIKKLVVIRETLAEKVFDIACELLKEHKDEIGVIVFDSIASMMPSAELDASLEDKQMAEMARVMSKAMCKLVHLNKNIALLIFINQLRTNPGASKYANPEYTPGGKALKYYASIRAEIKRGEWLMSEKNKDEKIGQVVKFRIIKNKTDVPNREGYFKYLYTGHLDQVDELVSLGILKGVITRKGAYFSVADQSFQGREALEKKLTEDKEFLEKARQEVFAD